MDDLNYKHSNMPETSFTMEQHLKKIQYQNDFQGLCIGNLDKVNSYQSSTHDTNLGDLNLGDVYDRETKPKILPVLYGGTGIGSKNYTKEEYEEHLKEMAARPKQPKPSWIKTIRLSIRYKSIQIWALIKEIGKVIVE